MKCPLVSPAASPYLAGGRACNGRRDVPLGSNGDDVVIADKDIG
jgi:hypothetical protein